MLERLHFQIAGCCKGVSFGKDLSTHSFGLVELEHMSRGKYTWVRVCLLVLMAHPAETNYFEGPHLETNPAGVANKMEGNAPKFRPQPCWREDFLPELEDHSITALVTVSQGRLRREPHGRRRGSLME